MSEPHTIEFFRLIQSGRPPKRAERSAAGLLPSRALRYCDALTTATAYGYWVFPPMDFRLLWTGEEIFWSYGEDESWLPLSGTDSSAVQFPDQEAAFDAAAPEFLRGYSPPFLTALPELGGVQMWTGLVTRTRPGWSLAVRSPVNVSPTPGIATWEGIIETDIWFGPLISIFRITRTDMPVQIRSHVPFLQVQPVPQLAYRDEVLGDFVCSDADGLVDEDWNRLSQILLPHPDRVARAGHYAVTVRKRRLCPVDHTALTDKPPGTS